VELPLLSLTFKKDIQAFRPGIMRIAGAIVDGSLKKLLGGLSLPPHNLEDE